MRIEERPCVDVGALSALTAVLATAPVVVARRPVVARSGFERRMGLLQPESGRHPCHASAIGTFTKLVSSISSVSSHAMRPATMPSWQQLPETARTTATSLMVRLLVEHAGSDLRSGSIGGRDDV